MEVTRKELIAQCCTEKRNQQGTSYFENAVGEIVAKACTKCSKILKMTGFVKARRRPDGHKPACKSCNNEIGRKYYADNSEKARSRSRIYREINHEKVLETNRKYRRDNSEKVREMRRNWNLANPEKVREINRIWQRANLGKLREKASKWKYNNPEKVSISNYRRRTRKALLPHTLTVEQQKAVLAHFEWSCALTGSNDYHMDHVVPLNCGHVGTIYENMILLRSDLNSSKSDRHIFEWFEANRERFKLSQTKFDALILYLAEVNGMSTREYRAYVDWCFDYRRNVYELTTEEDAV